jgi:hypothetical protein
MSLRSEHDIAVVDHPCFICSAPANGHARPDNDARGVRVAYLMCAAGHMFSARWLLSDEED